MLTSVDNPKVKYFNSLKEKKGRDRSGSFLIEGIHLVQEALEAGLIVRVLYSENIMRGHEGKELIGKLISSGVPMEEASEQVMKKISDVETPQGIIASAKTTEHDLSDILNAKDPLILVACGIQDPGNLGTMVRTADAVGAAGLIMTEGTVDPFNEKVVRATAGSIFHLKLVKFNDIIELVTSLKRRGIRVISTSADAKKPYFEADYSGPVAVLIGNEGQGMKPEVLRISDVTASIPMVGRAESLNASVSSAIILYEALRQRRTG
jgi:RNA methyltransferase, TrmH family